MKNSKILKVLVFLLVVSAVLIVVIGIILKNISETPPEAISSIKYAYTIDDEDRNFSLVRLNGMLVDQVESDSDSLVYSFLVDDVVAHWNPININLGMENDTIGTYRIDVEELEDGEVFLQSFVRLPVGEVVSNFVPGLNVEVHAMVNALPNAEELCSAENCRLLIESANKNMEWNADEFFKSVIRGESVTDNVNELRIIFITERI